MVMERKRQRRGSLREKGEQCGVRDTPRAWRSPSVTKSAS